MGNGNVWCCWVLKLCHKFFLQQRQLTDDDKKTTKNFHTVLFPCSSLHVDKRQKKCLTVPSPWKNSDKRQQEKNCLIVSSPQKNCLTIPSQCFRPHDSCSFPYAPLPMLLSTCFYCYLFKIGTHGKWNFFLKWWQMGYGDDRCCWVLKSFDKFFWQHQQFTDDDKKIIKNYHTVPSPRSRLHVDKRQKEKNVSLSHLHEKILTKDNKKKFASLSHLHKKFLLTKDNGDG